MLKQKNPEPNPIRAYAGEKFIAGLNFNDMKNVLEVGCRNGQMTWVLAEKYPHLNILGVDKEKSFIDAATLSSKYDQHKTRVQFHHSDYENLSSKQEFDAVVSFYCINWLEKARRRSVFQAIKEVLKPGGKAYLQIFLSHGRKRFDSCIRDVVGQQKWSSFFPKEGLPLNKVYLSEICSHVEESGLLFDKAEMRTFSYPFARKDEFKDFVRSWSSELLYIPVEKQETFLEDVLEANGGFQHLDYVFEMQLSTKKVKV